MRADQKNIIEKSAIDELCANARTLVHFYFRRPRLHSEPVIHRELEQLAKALERAGKTLNALGSQGIIRIYAAAGIMGDDDSVADFLQSGKILIVARWARAAIRANRTSLPEKMKPGPRNDRQLQSVVWLLADLYFKHLSMRPTSSTAPHTGKTTSMFNEFLKSAFADFAPPDALFSSRQLDSAARAVVKDLKTPP